MGQCAACGHRASERARFCEQCGAPLTADAQPLRAPEPLAQKILSERAGLEGERKQVTVMFTDIVGSMDLTRMLDTERWGVVLDRFLAIAARAVHGLEGTVNQFTGDGLMAVFGAPVAHEDHARRACLAVLRLQRDVAELATELRDSDGVEFAIRCGLNSGEVIVGSIGDDLHMDFAPLGNTTALGKRMESLAPVGSTALSTSTAALVEGEFELRELGEFEVKGADVTQRVLELVGASTARTRLDAVAATRGLSRFVGRDAERTALEDALERALAGDGHAVGIVGEPGVGKSRLVREFVAGCRSRGLSINTTSGVAHGRFVPFLPVLAMWRDYLGIGDHDAPEVARERIEAITLALDPALGADLPLLFDFLGVADPPRPLPPLDPEARQRQLLDAMSRSVTARSRQEAAVYIVEDLHWFDDASMAFLERLTEAAVGTRVLVVATYRPEHEATWAHDAPHLQLSLAPLDDTAAGKLLGHLLGSHASLDGLAEVIQERTGGNPFFMEEIVQALVETGRLTGAHGNHRLAADLEELVLPPTVQAVLAARIDRLAPREKALVQTMSVIGKEVPGPLLGQVSDLDEGELAAAVALLARAEMVTRRGANDSSAYVFKHPLTHEVAYGSQLSKPRARTHRAVARAIERTYPDGLDERAALLAHHCEAAGDKLDAAAWHARAAAWAEVTSPADGMRHWKRVRHLVGGLHPSAEVDELATKARIGILGLAWRLGMSAEETAAIHAEGQRQPVAAVPAAAPDREQSLLEVQYAAVRAWGGHEREGLAKLRQVHRHAVASQDVGLAVTASVALSVTNWFAGSLHEAVEVTTAALELAGGDTTAGDRMIMPSAYALAVGYRGVFRGFMGEVPAAMRDVGRGLEIAHAQGGHETECYLHAISSALLAEVGEVDAARDHAVLAREIANRAGNDIGVTAASTALSLSEVTAGRFAEALAIAEPALAAVGEQGTGHFCAPRLLAAIARARLGMGEADAALAAAEGGVAATEARGLTVCALPARIALAQVLLETEGLAAADRIEAVLARAMEVARESHARIYEPQIHRELAALARLRGDEDAAARAEGEAERLVAETRSAAPHAVSQDRFLLDLNFATALATGGREREGIAKLRQVHRQIMASGDAGLAVTSGAALAVVDWVAGSLAEAIEATTAALDLAGGDITAGHGLNMPSPYAIALGYRGVFHGFMGDLTASTRDVERGLEIAREQEGHETECFLHAMRSLLMSEVGEPDVARRDAVLAGEIAERIGNALGAVLAATALSASDVAAGRFAEALSDAESTLMAIGEQGTGQFAKSLLLAAVARSRLALGEADAALAAAEEGVAAVEARRLTVCGLPARIALAQVLNATEGAAVSDRIEGVLARAMEVARENHARLYEPQVHRELVALARLRGDEEAAAHEEAAAERGLSEDLTPSAEQLQLDLYYAGNLHWVGREREALDAISRVVPRAIAAQCWDLVTVGDPPLAYGHWVAGSLAAGVEAAEQAVRLTHDDPSVGTGFWFVSPRAQALQVRGLCKGYATERESALEDFERAIAFARDDRDGEAECYAHINRAFVEVELGEAEAAARDAARAAELAERSDNRVCLLGASMARAGADAASGRFDEALESALATLTEIREVGTVLFGEPMLLATIARSRLAIGDPDSAIAAAEEGVAIMEERELKACALSAPIALAQILIATEGADAAQRIEGVLARASEIVEESGARVFAPQIERERAALAELAASP